MSEIFERIRIFCNKRITKKTWKVIDYGEFERFIQKSVHRYNGENILNYKRLLVRAGYLEGVSTGGDFIVVKEIPDRKNIKDKPNFENGEWVA